MTTEVKEYWRFETTDNVSFQNMFDMDNDFKLKAPGRVHICTLLVMAINRNMPTETLMETEVQIYFYNERNWLGGSDSTSYYEVSSVNYWARKRALAYFCDINYKNKPEDVKKFIEATKNKTWCFDSVIIKTEEKRWDGKSIV